MARAMASIVRSGCLVMPRCMDRISAHARAGHRDSPPEADPVLPAHALGDAWDLVRADPADHRGPDDPAGEPPGAGQRVGSAAGSASHREPADPQQIGGLGDISGPVGDGPSRLEVGQPVARTVQRDHPQAGSGRGLPGEPRLQARAGMPVEIEDRLPVRLPVPRVPEPAAIAEQQRPILAGITGFHPADHIAPIRTPGNDPAGTSQATPDGGYMRTSRGPRRRRPQRGDAGPGNAWPGGSGGQGSAARPPVRGDRRLAGTCLMRAADPEPPPACWPARRMPRWHIDTMAGKWTAIPAPALPGQQDPGTGPGVRAGRPSTPARAGQAADHRR